MVTLSRPPFPAAPSWRPQPHHAPAAQVVTLALALSASCSAFVGPAASLRPQSRVAAAPAMAMGPEEATSRRALLASLVLAAPAAANAMIVPGLNGPGLVKAKKVPKSGSTGFGRDFEAIRDRTNFWSSKGVGRRLPSSRVLRPAGQPVVHA